MCGRERERERAGERVCVCELRKLDKVHIRSITQFVVHHTMINNIYAYVYPW